MRATFKLVVSGALVAGSASSLHAQDLAPRAYIITPLHSNAITLTYAYYDGNILFDGTIPVTDATAKVSVPVLSYYHSLSFFGRSANLVVSLPYGVGNYEGDVIGTEKKLYRSGLLDANFRFSVNLMGGPAMTGEELRKWQQKTLLGASIRIVAPTGQYDGTRLINWGANRWAFKAELGYSERWGHWVLDGYGAVWLYTTNSDFFSASAQVPGLQSQTQKSIGALEAHLSYDMKSRRWVSLDANFWFGGRTSLNGVENPATEQTSSRIGLTASTPLSKHHSLKVAYSRGAYIRFGGDYQNISLAWQYSWIGWPR
jgi:hypothetical protein